MWNLTVDYYCSKIPFLLGILGFDWDLNPPGLDGKSMGLHTLQMSNIIN
jgi:hypothetical protein